MDFVLNFALVAALPAQHLHAKNASPSVTEMTLHMGCELLILSRKRRGACLLAGSPSLEFFMETVGDEEYWNSCYN